MRKVFSILLIVQVLFSGITFNLARHYCEGSVIDTKVSLSDELAGCGMENSNNHSTGQVFSNKCCEDVISDLTLNNTYLQSTFALENVNLPFIGDLILPTETGPLVSVSFTNINSRPPGAIPNEVDREVICIYRI